MTVATEIDRTVADDPHPIYSMIGRPPSNLIHVVRHDGRFRWIKTQEAANAPCKHLPCDRLGVILYDYTTGESLGVGIDIDGASHGKGLSADQLSEVDSRQPEYVSLGVTSTSGTGRHKFILWTAPIICTLEEHRNLCQRAAIEYERLLNLPYGVVDVPTNPLWTYAVDKGEGAFVGTPTAGRLDPTTLPPLPQLPGRQGEPPPELNDAGRELMEFAKGTPFACQWDDNIKAIKVHKGLLVLLQKHYPGLFVTDSRCTDPSTANCWLRWNEGGWWDVYCWGGETTWEKTANGFLHATFGKPSTFQAANAKGMAESSHCYRYSTPDDAIDAVRQITGKAPVIPDSLRTAGRQFDVARKGTVIQLRAHKSHPAEPCPEGWSTANRFFWFGSDSAPPDAIVAKVKQQFWQTCQSRTLTGIYRYTGSGRPIAHSRQEAYSVARSLVGPDGTALIDEATAKPVELICEAFAPTLQPGRLNVGPYFVVDESPGRCDTWLMMLLRLGDSLTPALIDPQAPWAEWCRKHRITSGGRYLLWWVSYLIQHPRQRLPILAFVGEPDDGKSTFGDALSELWCDDGTSDVGELLRTKSQFTGPIAQSVLGRIEDCDISKREHLLRLLPLVTAPKLLCEFKGRTPFFVPNQLHIVVTTNRPGDIPVHDGDCRFVVIQTVSLGDDKDVEYPNRLKAERAAFLHMVKRVKLPTGSQRYSRLALPDVSTAAKEDVVDGNRIQCEVFADECLTTEGATRKDRISNQQLYDLYREWCVSGCRSPECSDSRDLASQLGAWLTARGIQLYRTATERGREGIKVRT